MRIKLSDCNECNALCCANPPMLQSEQEIAFAKSKGVELLAYTKDNYHYFIMIAKKNGYCPFLLNNRCSVYDNRFNSCKEYTCKMLGDNGADIIKLCLGGDMKPVNLIHPALFSREVINKQNIKIASDDEVTEKVFMTDAKIFIDFVSEKLRKV